MAQVLLEKTLLEILDVTPNHSIPYKTVQGDKIDLSITLRSNEHPANIILELWTNLSEKNPLRFHARKIKCKKQQDDKLVYSAKILVNDTGFFDIFVRYRTIKETFWKWYEHNSQPVKLEIHCDPVWIKNAIVYNAFIRFFGAKRKNTPLHPGDAGTFDDLIKKLNHLKKLGVNVLYLNPIHPIGELYRNYNPHDLLPKYLQPGSPYSIRDYKTIDPEIAYSTEHEIEALTDPLREFKELVDNAHKLGIRVIMDMVFNHTAHDFVLQRMHPEWYLYKMNIKDLDEPYIYPQELTKGKPWGDAKHTFCPYDHGYWWEDTAQLNWEYKIPAAKYQTPPPNPTKKLMWDYFKSVTKYWVQNVGIDGFRCDVAYRIPPQFWKECIRETRALAKQCANECAISKDVIFIAESYVDDLYEL
ncbi:hypothetical protein HY484_00945, partial [Candidatus Woesearchaeota archaeon]|nr:hypothetical protein [Candidatus Woesearchaeota archaeon]